MCCGHQLHISGLFPRKRGLISSLFVAGFTGSCIIFYILQKIFEDLGSTQCVILRSQPDITHVLSVKFSGNFELLPLHLKIAGMLRTSW